MNRRDLFAALLCVSLATLAPACATSAQGQQASSAQTYRIRVRRTVAVGDRFRVEGRGESRRRTEVTDSFRRRVGGEEEMSSAEFAGEATVRAVDDEGYVTGVAVVVRRAVADNGERSWTFLEPGSTITIDSSRGDVDPRVEQEGAAIDASAMQFLSLAYDLRSLYGVRASMFGPSGRRAIGERWPVPALSAVTVASGEATITLEDGTQQTVRLPTTTSTASSAEATLVRLANIDGVNCFEVRTTLRSEVPTDSGVRGSQTNEWTMFLPRARRRRPLGMSVRNTVDAQSGGMIDGRPVRERMIAERTTTVRFAELR
ncbi:MAG: hypothetical protein JNK05_30030 [Myxococcales bacterium]|nr:hypothetical protein [Myxococcales bacterium]